MLNKTNFVSSELQKGNSYVADAFTKLNYAHTYWLNLFSKTERIGIDKVWDWTLSDLGLFWYKNIIAHSAPIN